MFKVKSDYHSAVQSQDQGTVIGEHNKYNDNGSGSLKVDLKYCTGVESNDKGTILVRDHNASILATDLEEGLNINSIVRNVAGLYSDYSLTNAALAAHGQHLDNQLDEAHASSRIDDILRAAREMGFVLPRECFQLDKWDLPEWIEAQVRLRGEED
jgi:hypothetical protein